MTAPAKKHTAFRLNDRQLAFLQAEAERLSITVSDVIRRIIDAHIDNKRKPRK